MTMNLRVTLQVPVYMEIRNHKMCFEYLLFDRILMQCILFGTTRQKPVCDDEFSFGSGFTVGYIQAIQVVVR